MKMIFPFEVKYNGEYCSQNEIVDVNETDMQELIGIGGCIVEEAQKPIPAKRGRKSDTTRTAKALVAR